MSSHNNSMNPLVFSALLFVVVIFITGLLIYLYFYRQRVVELERNNVDSHQVILGKNELLAKDIGELEKGVNDQTSVLKDFQGQVADLESKINVQRAHVLAFAEKFQQALDHMMQEQDANLEQQLKQITSEVDTQINSLKNEVDGLRVVSQTLLDEVSNKLVINNEQVKQLQVAFQHNISLLDACAELLKRIELYKMDIELVATKVATLKDRTASLTRDNYNRLLETVREYSDNMANINNADKLYLSRDVYNTLMSTLGQMSSDVQTLRTMVQQYKPAADMKQEVDDLGNVIQIYVTSVNSLKTDLQTFNAKEYESRLTALVGRISAMSDRLQVQDPSKNVATHPKRESLTQLEALRREVTEQSMQINNLWAHLEPLEGDQSGRLNLEQKVCMDSDEFACIDEGVMSEFLSRF